MEFVLNTQQRQSSALKIGQKRAPGILMAIAAIIGGGCSITA